MSDGGPQSVAGRQFVTLHVFMRGNYWEIHGKAVNSKFSSKNAILAYFWVFPCSLL